MKVPIDYKMQMMLTMMPTVFDALAGGAEDGDVTADDVVDFFAMSVAAIIDNDTRLKTPRDLRMGAETVAKRMEGWAKEFRKGQDETGVSWLTVAMAGARPDAATTVQ